MSRAVDTQSLRAEIDLSHQIVEASPLFFVAIDSAGRVLRMNQTMLKTLGYERDEVIGQEYMRMFVPQRDRPMLAAVFAELSAATQATVNENYILTKSGSELLVEWHGRPVFNAQGGFDYFFGTGIPIDARRRMEDALRRSEQRLELHVQRTPLGVIEWDTDGKISTWNPAAQRIFGYSREEALGRAQEIIVPEGKREGEPELWRSGLEPRGGGRATSENRTKDGRVIVCDWYNTSLVDAGGQVIGVASLVDDVTEQRRAEEELRRRERSQAETIQRLSAPVIDMWEGILALPVIGAIDDVRAARMTESLLEAIVRMRASFAIVDLTGATEVDAATARHLIALVRTTELLGACCLVSGLSPFIARTLIELGVDLGGLTTFGTLRAALAHAFRRSPGGGGPSSR